MHADAPLAKRLERAGAGIARDCVAAHRRLFPMSEATSLDFCGGVAAFLDEASPLTQIKGGGMEEAVREEDLEAVEQFYAERACPVSFVLTPFAHDALFTYLSRRGYELGGFENTLVRLITEADAIEADPHVETAGAREWAGALAESFFDSVTPGAIELGRVLHALPTSQSQVIKVDGLIVAAAQVDIRDGLATLQCDGTIRRYRSIGLQKKLIRSRLSRAADAGCDLATADTQPGSVSQQNYEKMGFQVAYTKIVLVKPPA